MAEDRKPELNGPPISHSINHRDENPRGGRNNRFTRFGPRSRNHDGGHGSQHFNDGDQAIEDNEMSHQRGRRFPGRGGKIGNYISKGDDSFRNKHEDRIHEKLCTMSGSTYDLPLKDNTEQKFSSRCRLYIGNLSDITEDEVKEMFSKYGEISECFVNPEKQFSFIRLDYRANAERAKRELDGTLRKNKPLKVRFAPVGAAIKVKNLTQWVTNELLEYAFSVFGDIEHAHVLVDERGNSLKEGIVEFARKPVALLALRRCAEGCFFLTASLRPVVAEPYDVIDDVDGFPEKAITRKHPEYTKSREIGPRFAPQNSFEFEYGTRWKQLYDLFKQKEEALKKELKLEEEKLEAQMEYAKFEHDTEMLREQLRQREMDRERQKMEWEMKERQAEEQRRQDEEMVRRRTDEVGVRMLHSEEDLRRRHKDNSIFLQVQQLSSRLDSERGAPVGPFGDGNMPGEPLRVRNDEFEGQNEDQQPLYARRGGRWGHSRPQLDIFPNKRRRFLIP